jgi:hypothetical protein
VLAKGTDPNKYQLSILNQYIGSASISNQFSSQIKNRINMLNTKNKSRSAWKSLLILPITMMLFALISCGNEEQVKTAPDEATAPYEEELFFVVEEMPQWNDGTDMITNTRNFIAQNLTYPKEAIENNVEGKIFIQFIVNSKGEVIIPDPAMLPPELNKGKENEVVVVGYRTINEEDAMPDEKYIQLLKDEAVRVMNEVPDMIPGKQRGKAVSVVFTMPIVFKLQ